MRNPVTIPLTKDRKRNLIISFDNIIALGEDNRGACLVTHSISGNVHQEESEFSSTELFEEICSPSK